MKSADKDYPGILTEIAAKNGFEFSKEELLEQIRAATSSEELSDEQLEAVAGGKSGHGIGSAAKTAYKANLIAHDAVNHALGDGMKNAVQKATKGW